MARKRVKVDTQRLRSMGEVTRAVARPVDTFVTPARLPDNPRSLQIANALASVNPSIQRYLKNEGERYVKGQREEGEKTFYQATPEERKKYEKGIRNGTIDETQSPYWMEGFARSLLTNHFKKYAEDTMMEYEKRRHDPNFNLDEFLLENRKKYMKDNQIDGFRADILNDEFLDRTQALDQQIGQREYERKILDIRRQNNDLLLGEVEGTLDSLVDDEILLQRNEDGTLKNNLDVTDVTEEINAKLQSAMDRGADRSDTLNRAIEYLKGQARILAREGGDYEAVLEVLSGIKNKGGTYGQSNANDFEIFSEKMDSLAEKAKNEEFQEQVEADQQEAYKLRQTLIKGIQDNDYSQSYYDSDDFQEQLDRLKILDGQSHLEVVNTYKSKGETPKVSDESIVDMLELDIQNGIDALPAINSYEADGLITTETAKALREMNTKRVGSLVDYLGLPTNLLSDLEDSVQTRELDAATSIMMNGKTHIKDPARKGVALRARTEMKQWLSQSASRLRGMEDRQAATKEITDKYNEIVKKYQGMPLDNGTNLNSGDVSTSGSGSTVQNDAVVDEKNKITPTTNKEAPWLKEDGTKAYTNQQISGAFSTYVEKTIEDKAEGTNVRFTTEFGKLIQPLVESGKMTERQAIEAVLSVYAKGTPNPEKKPDDKNEYDLGIYGEMGDEMANDLQATMRRTGTSITMVLPEDFEVSSVTPLTREGGVSGMSLYEGTINGMPYKTIAPTKNVTATQPENKPTVDSGDVNSVNTSSASTSEKFNTAGQGNSSTPLSDAFGTGNTFTNNPSEAEDKELTIDETADIVTNASSLLKELEGMEAIPYPDGKGKSVGYGFYLTSLEPDERALIKDINNVQQAEADAVLDLKVRKIVNAFNNDIAQFSTLSPQRQAALISMAYQLGYENVTAQGVDPAKQWPRFIQLVQEAALASGMKRESLFNRAATEMLKNANGTSTGWMKQTPTRAKQMSRMIQRGRK